MERDHSSSFFPLQQDEFPVNFPDFSIWDVGFDHFLFPDHDSPKVEAQNYKQNEVPKNLQEIEGATTKQEVEKKMMHREIEKERRKEMTTLYASLRSVLPSNFIKNKVRQLEMKRDNIKKSRENGKVGSMREKGSSSKSLPITVVVQRCYVGVEVLISFDFAAEERRQLRLSRILQLLLEEGLNVVDCNCNKFNGMLHCMIQSEAQGCPIIDHEMLQGKLTSAI